MRSGQALCRYVFVPFLALEDRSKQVGTTYLSTTTTKQIRQLRERGTFGGGGGGGNYKVYKMI